MQSWELRCSTYTGMLCCAAALRSVSFRLCPLRSLIA